MESMTFVGTITATSNKVNEKFKTDNPTKTAYITVGNPKDVEKMKAFGLTLYSSKENPDETFFIVKLSREVKVYDSFNKSAKPTILSGSVETPNFKTKEVAMNLLKGEHIGNDFYRINAISVVDATDIETIEAENPFA